MYVKKEYHTLRTVANLISSLGWGVVVMLLAVGFIGGWYMSGWRMTGIIMGLLSGATLGLVLGVPVIVLGQLPSVFLDQKELLEEIAGQGKTH